MKIQKSAGGLIYRIDETATLRFLLIKRYSLAKTIERVTAKGKVEPGESMEAAALREVYEEAGIQTDQITLRDMIGDVTLRLHAVAGVPHKKVITLFLMYYTGSENDVHLQQGEGFLGYYKRATIDEVLGLVHYHNLRELFRRAYHCALTYHDDIVS